MPPKIVPFSFKGNVVRVHIREGKPWFFAFDVCKILQIRNARQATSRLKPTEKDRVISNDAAGRPHDFVEVNLPGLFRLVFLSRKLVAEEFQDWVYYDVLPSIWETGNYIGNPTKNQWLEEIRQLVEPVRVQHGQQITRQQERLDDHESRLIELEQSPPRPRRKLSVVDANTEAPAQGSFNFSGTPTPVKPPSPSDDPPSAAVLAPVEAPKPLPPASSAVELGHRSRPKVRFETVRNDRPKIIFEE